MLSPEQQAADYRAQGYDFLALTDHNIMKTHVQFNSDDFLMIPGWERDIPYGTTKCLHVVGLFPSDTPDGSVITRPRGNPDVMSQQQLIDQMRSENVFVEIAHPIWSRMEPEELRALQGFNAIEIFNTGTERLCHAGLCVPVRLFFEKTRPVEGDFIPHIYVAVSSRNPVFLFGQTVDLRKRQLES